MEALVPQLKHLPSERVAEVEACIAACRERIAIGHGPPMQRVLHKLPEVPVDAVHQLCGRLSSRQLAEQAPGDGPWEIRQALLDALIQLLANALLAGVVLLTLLSGFHYLFRATFSYEES